MLFHVYYNAFLIAILSSAKIILPFDDLTGLYNQQDKWTIGVMKDSFLETLFQVNNLGENGFLLNLKLLLLIIIIFFSVD